jgi:hypothetical protein
LLNLVKAKYQMKAVRETKGGLLTHTFEGLEFGKTYDAQWYSGASTAAATVPEPATMLLVGRGLVGLAWFGKKFKK